MGYCLLVERNVFSENAFHPIDIALAFLNRSLLTTAEDQITRTNALSFLAVLLFLLRELSIPIEPLLLDTLEHTFVVLRLLLFHRFELADYLVCLALDVELGVLVWIEFLGETEVLDRELQIVHCRVYVFGTAFRPPVAMKGSNTGLCRSY